MGVVGVSSTRKWRLEAVAGQLPVLAVLVVALALWLVTISGKVQVQIDDARSSAGRELAGLAEFARSQSAAFASTSFIGYSVGRYYGFAPAYAQISPDPERAASLLRNAYLKEGPTPSDLPPALAAYDAVHARFHPNFVDLLGSTVFDDLYLIDRFGRVVYSLRKDALFAADLGEARMRAAPLGELFRDVMARIQQADKPQEVLAVSQPKRLEDAAAILVARPIVRHGAVEGVVAFRLPLTQVERRFEAIRRPGLRFQLLDSAGAPVLGEPAGSGESAHGPYSVEEAGWSYAVVSRSGALGGRMAWLAALLLLAGLAAAWWSAKRTAAPAAVQPLPVAPPTVPAAAPAAIPAPAVSESPEPPALVAHEEELPPAGDAPPASPELASVPAELPDDFDADETYRRCIVDVMTAALDTWHRAKHKGKIELAEESGLWRVYMDRSSLQTRTLDKYLLVETLPRNPRWRDVVRTAEYVLRHCPEPTPEREDLQGALARLKQQLRQAERI